MSPRRVIAAVLATLGVLVVFVAGVVVGGHAQATGLTQLRDPLRGLLLGDSGQDLSGQVLDLLEDDYYEKVDPTKLQSTSVDAMVDALGDPYTDYLDPGGAARRCASATTAPTTAWGCRWPSTTTRSW